MRSELRGRVGRQLATTLLVCLTGAYPWVARAQGVQVGLLPLEQSVAPGSDFTVELDVTAAGSPFNAFDVVVTYDPSLLTYVPAVPSKLQEGCLMNGLCSPACGNTSLFVSASADSVWISDGLLCASTLVTGPGQLYRLQFHAADIVAVTTIGIRSFYAYDAGTYVNPIAKTETSIGIGVTLGTGRTPPLARAWAVSAAPNPARGVVTLSVESDNAGEQELGVYDVLGRLVRVLSRSWQAPGTRQVTWDARDAAGLRVPPGLYLVTLRAGQRIARGRVVLID